MSVWPGVVLLAGSKCQLWSATALSTLHCPQLGGLMVFWTTPYGAYDFDRRGELCKMITAQHE
ncbi:hypothetical protein H112_07157 [Trichophyton rubrum D6]|uniref:Uncharacterized protein n=2 Tax=Trichophyton TaxID=5550 RepID=A0A022VTL1_TRIRU|nr:hypothetical protein H100_07182 [Trichophyton rubrum MR850]EZF38660.1 hypothetical protein H102_07142 [Trichophyton rubrum CBS 100081]EZF49284.1 hypothetical protein H103_07165 [Trichophyton rubrum CBS 288.86]EZF59912.1 hypothetical protein H104_07119 [Trichophyton rubrum CBS 289.86]EZF70538.1 hypothetical protein H105_07177 [Trichophyton soudanense CBS 452.61]EZF81173.1 hypothetical protein H110_07165 [Trichophyton rubrum MR1448]EZF91721.1 hypothetical protein H113_07218 [Trichophyton rub